MRDPLYLDTEIYNETPITAGTYRYAESAELVIITWAVGNGPVQTWDYSDGTPPPDLVSLAQGRWVIAHNAMFDRNVLRLGNLRMEIPLANWQCTMVQAMQHALPGSLAQLGDALGLDADQQKDADGKKLIQRFCKPAPSNHKAERYTRETHPDEWSRFLDYAAQDIVTLREIHKRLPTYNWTAADIADYHLDQRINDRGFQVDTELAEAGAAAAITEKDVLQRRFAELTGGLAPTQRAKVQAWIAGRYGLRLEATAKHIMEPMASDERLPADLREICRIMLSANKTSTAKYASIAAAVSSDERFRGGLQFAGASRTRRWAGRTFQPQNLPSRGLPPGDMIELYIAALKAGAHVGVFDDLMLYGAAALRGVVVAPPGMKLVVSDLSNIEGRVLAYLAGEEWKLQAFRDYDAGTGPDLYNITASSILGIDPYQIEKKQRNVYGKVPDLACGYEGGAGAFQTFAKAYGVKMEDQWDTIKANMPADVIARAWENLERFGREKQLELEISEVEWVASESVKLAWRDRHPATRSLWYEAKDAAAAATRMPGGVFRAGPHLQFCCIGDWLLVKLPSGRYLTYYQPRVDEADNISYMGMGDGLRRVWCRQYTYGGKIVENATQALAGDVLKGCMPGAEVAGYQTVLSVHDELVTQTPDRPEWNADGLSSILATPPVWAPTLPLAAAGFESYRYKKED